MRAICGPLSLAASLLLSLGLTACGRTEKLDAPPPTALTGTVAESLPPVPLSRLDIPVTYDLRPALDWLEAEVPIDIGDINQRIAVPDNDRVHIAYAISREPFRVSIRGSTATISSIIHYEGQGWYNPPLLPEVSASCGSGERRPRARLVLRATIEVNDRWMLSPRATATAEPLTATERDQCKVTVLSIDVTEKVLNAAEAALQGEVDDVEHEARVFPLRASVAEIWSVLRQPIRLTDSLWLLVGPVSVRLRRPNLVGDTLVYLAGLTANPRIVGGPRPDSTSEPLLPLDRSPAPLSALVIQSEGTLPYDAAEAILSKVVAGKELRIGRRTLVIRHLRPIALGDGRLAVALTIGGAAEGTVYGVGHPQIDSTGLLTIPDLSLDAGTVSSAGGALHWLIETDAIQQYLRTAVTINLAPTIEKGRVLAEKNLNRELASGVFLHATLERAVPVGVWAGPQALVARVVVTGQGSITVDLPPPVHGGKTRHHKR
jgi:hypothetical protein